LSHSKNSFWRRKYEDYLLKDVVVDCVLGDDEADKHASGKQRYERARLATKIYDEPDSDFTVEDIALLKEHVGRKAPALYVKQCWDAMETPLPTTEPKPVA